RENNLSGTPGPDAATDASEHPHHVVIGRVQRGFALEQNFGEKPEDHRAARYAADAGDRQGRQKPESVIAVEQVAGSSEPGQESCDGAEVEPRQIARMASAGMPELDSVMEMHIGKMQVAHARQERDRAQTETDQETDEIEIRPGHDRLP